MVCVDIYYHMPNPAFTMASSAPLSSSSFADDDTPESLYGGVYKVSGPCTFTCGCAQPCVHPLYLHTERCALVGTKHSGGGRQNVRLLYARVGMCVGPGTTQDVVAAAV